MSRAIKEILNEASVAASTITSLSDCEALDLIHSQTLAITARATFHANADANLRVHLRSSPDDLNYDTVDIGADEDGYFDLNYVAGSTEQKTAFIYRNPRYLKVLVQNLSSNYPVSDVIVTAITEME